MSIETQLRDTLHRAAVGIGPEHPDAALRSQGMHQLARRRSRRRAAVATSGLAALLVIVAVPVGQSLREPSGGDTAAPSVPAGDVYDVPTRGSLAGSSGFVDAVRELPWTGPGTDAGAGEFPDPPAERRRVVFVGDVAGGGRWALVIGPNTTQPTGDAADPDLQTDLGALSDIAAAWFVGPAGASPEQMQLVSVPRGISPDLPLSLYDGVSGALVVVAAPGDVVEISARPDVAADASISRTFTQPDARDGVAVTLTQPNPYGSMPSVQYRVTRAGAVVAEQTPDGYVEPGTVLTVQGGELNFLRQPVEGLLEGFPGEQAQRMAVGILGEYGLGSDQIDLQVHYAGPVPGAGDAPAGLTVLTATFPSGAVLTRAEWLQQLSDPGSFRLSRCTDALTPAGLPAVQRVMAIRCDVDSGDAQSSARESTLIVIAPAALGGNKVVVTGTSGSSTFQLAEDGTVLAPFPDGAQRVVIQTPDGTALGEAPIATS